MTSPVLAVVVTTLLATGGAKAPSEPAPAPSPAPASEPAPTPAPTSDAAIQDNGWSAEPAPAATGPTPAPTVATPPAADPAAEERLWRLKQHNRFKGIMVSGFTTLGAVYGASVLIGALSIDFARDDDNERQRQYGRRMMIPLAGPFAAAPVSRSATLGVLTVAAGLGQLLGLSMGIAGAVKLREFPNPNKPKFAFGAMPTRGGAHMGLSLRF
jgi:hypothetical protein